MRFCLCPAKSVQVAALLVLALFNGLALAQISASSDQARPELRISVSGVPPVVTPEGDSYLNLIFETLFERSGIDFKLISTPPRRGVDDADSGVIDAAVTPYMHMGAGYPNLVVLPHSILAIELSGIYTRDDMSIVSVDDFFDYRLAYIRGWRQVESMFEGHENVEKVRQDTLLMSMLAQDRVDVVFMATATAKYIGRQMGIEDLKVSDFYIKRHIFLHVNKRYVDLIRVLERQLLAMKEDGTMESILSGYTLEH